MTSPTKRRSHHRAPLPPAAPRLHDTTPINPDFVYRVSDGPKYFGFLPTALDQKIKSGEIPEPLFLSDSGRARGWLGRTILQWQADRAAASAKTAARKPESKPRKSA
jgi:predicted DNA-binding transcriptional regulator AlpA